MGAPKANQLTKSIVTFITGTSPIPREHTKEMSVCESASVGFSEDDLTYFIPRAPPRAELQICVCLDNSRVNDDRPITNEAFTRALNV
jgi:hypothetical protein